MSPVVLSLSLCVTQTWQAYALLVRALNEALGIFIHIISYCISPFSLLLCKAVLYASVLDASLQAALNSLWNKMGNV